MKEQGIHLTSVIPILRMFDERKAKQFYLEYLGFEVSWEHRFSAELPLYMEVHRGSCFLHLSEHHGDACPGSAIRIATQHIQAFYAELTAKDYSYARPGLELAPWGAWEMNIHDPFGNRLIFFEQAEG